MPDTEIYRPSSLTDAVAFLAANPGAIALAGGTDVAIDKRLGKIAPSHLVDLSVLDGALAQVSIGEREIVLGGLARIRTLEFSEELSRTVPAVPEAARVLGSPQIRTMATLGGNLCHATPSADMPPALLVHDATAVAVGAGGAEREFPLAELFSGPGATTLAPGELLARVVLRRPGARAGSVYLRQTVRWAMDLAGVGVAAALELDGDTIVNAAVALGAVSPTPMLVPDAHELLVGRPYDDERAQELGARAAAACSPITDARGSERYRRRVVAALVPRALRIAHLRAIGAYTQRYAPTNGVLTDDVLPGGGR